MERGERRDWGLNQKGPVLGFWVVYQFADTLPDSDWATMRYRCGASRASRLSVLLHGRPLGLTPQSSCTIIDNYQMQPFTPLASATATQPGSEFGFGRKSAQLYWCRSDMSTLEKKLDALIAQQDNIKPDAVTLEYIRNQRDKNGDVSYDFSTRYGGYHRKGGRVLTPAQSSALVSAAYRFLGRFTRQK